MQDKKNEAPGQVSPGVAHALRTPLGALVSALDVAELPGIDAGTRQDALNTVRRQAMRLASLIERLENAR